jgi:hypothetical protein
MALCIGNTSAAEPAAPLGRLFFTPEMRASLDRQRQLDIRQARSIESDTMRLDGVVVRSSGKSTVWVNNRPQDEGAQDTGVAATTSRQQPGSARLATSGDTPADLKVGVTLDRTTRETAGGLAGGEIRVNRPKPQQ